MILGFLYHLIYNLLIFVAINYLLNTIAHENWIRNFHQNIVDAINVKVPIHNYGENHHEIHLNQQVEYIAVTPS